MKCVDCQNQGMCLDHKEQSSLIGCTSGIPQRKKQTNADHIRSFSDEELAEFIRELNECCLAGAGMVDCSNNTDCIDCKGVVLEWLQSEVEETR